MALWVAVIFMVGFEQGPRQTPRIQVADSWIHQRVRGAVLGAQQRLERPECRRVLTDFRDVDGRPLLERLQATALTAADYLFDRVWFVDAGETPQCQRDPAMAAFTSPGHKVVRICTNRFAKRYDRQLVAAEILIIHEMLHTLGLAENPPTTSQITAQVTRRCGKS